MQKVQKVSATGSVSGAGVTRSDRESSGEQYLPERAHASGPHFEMSMDDDGGTCCNSWQNGIVQPLLTGTPNEEMRSN